ncbi:MAG: LamG-like jellyroll fold domain-containing protein [Rhodothermales bacterium]
MVIKSIISHTRLAVCQMVLVALVAVPSAAQVRVVHVPKAVAIGQPVVLYVQVEADGLVIESSSAYRVNTVRYRTYAGWAHARISVEDQAWMMDASGLRNVAVTVTATEAVRDATLFIRPVQYAEEDRRIVRGAPVRLALPESRPALRSPFRHGVFDSKTPSNGIVREGQSIPEHHTLEFWMRTGSTDQVVATSWTGRESDPYPFEVTVDASGHVVAYRGNGREHVSLRSPGPVADGTWHHVAVVSGKWWTLMIDGAAADSLLARRLPAGTKAFRAPVSLGGAFTGALDEVRLWDRSWTPGQVRSRMRQHSTTLVDSPLLVESFESSGQRTVRSDLMLFRPPRDIQVSFRETGMTLTWQPGEPGVRTFIVERSGLDGEFEAVARMDGGVVANTDVVSWQADRPESGIRYYRIRQLHANGADVVSAAIKIGAGVEQPETALPARITGNYPNPFRERTIITYAVDRPAYIRISVWDLSGQLVRVLLDGNRPVGTHETMFIPDDLPSGTYFAHMEVDGRTQTHRMVVAR